MSQIEEDSNEVERPVRRPDAYPAGSNMPDRRRTAIRAVLATGTDVCTVLNETSNTFLVRNDATQEISAITSPGMAEMYLSRLRGITEGGPA